MANRMSKNDRDLIKQNLRSLHAMTKKELAATSGVRPRLLLVHDTDDDVTQPEIINFDNYIDDPDVMTAMLKAYKMQPTVSISVFMSEAWGLSINADSEQGKRLKSGEEPFPKDISQHPDREEIVSYLVESRTGVLAASAAIIRNGDDASFGPLEFDDNVVGGSIVGTVL
jgi:hypothetical protein